MVSGYSWFLNIQGFWIFVVSEYSGFLDMLGFWIFRVFWILMVP